MPRKCEILAWLRGRWMSMGRSASPLYARWRWGRFVFLARTLRLRSVGLLGRMVDRPRNPWGRFGFVWLGDVVVRTRAVMLLRAVVLGSRDLETLRLMVGSVGRAGPTLRVAQTLRSSLRVSCLLAIGRPCGALRSSGRWSWFCGWGEGPGGVVSGWRATPGWRRTRGGGEPEVVASPRRQRARGGVGDQAAGDPGRAGAGAMG
jgi:hypothetical protein